MLCHSAAMTLECDLKYESAVPPEQEPSTLLVLLSEKG